MADLITLAEWKTRTGTTSTDATRDAAVEAFIDAVSADIQGRLGRQFGTGSQTYVLDAPPSDTLLVPTGPFTISTLTVSLNLDAGGDSSLFTSDHLLTVYTDYAADPDPDTPTVCTSRRVFRSHGAAWGWERRRDVGRLAPYYAPATGAVKVTYTLADAVPEDVKAAAADAVTMLYNGRQFGGPLTNESRGAYSYTRAAGGADTAPDAVSAVWPRVAKYARLDRLIGWSTRGR